LADCGVGSRRSCEKLITEGRVAVNGSIVTELGSRILPGRDSVELDSQEVAPQSCCYVLLNKPRDVISTSSDPQGRKTVLDLVSIPSVRLYTVGRLDRSSEGLLLLTNDGDLANRLMHPRHHIDRVYEVIIDRTLKRTEERKFVEGIHDDGDVLKAVSIQLLNVTSRGPRYELVLREGKNRQIRRMVHACGCKVQQLKRTAMGSLQLNGLRVGQWRYLTDAEVKELKK
jgi:pseudouridine synthase